MSFEAFERAIELIEGNDAVDYFGECPVEIIDEIESLLEVRFPKSYRCFLNKYSVGIFGGNEIYGIIPYNPTAKGIPSLYGVNIRMRNENDLPKHLIAIFELGNGEVYCIDCSKSEENNFPVVVFHLHFPIDSQRNEVMNSGFGEFLENCLLLAGDE